MTMRLSDDRFDQLLRGVLDDIAEGTAGSAAPAAVVAGRMGARSTTRAGALRLALVAATVLLAIAALAVGARLLLAPERGPGILLIADGNLLHLAEGATSPERLAGGNAGEGRNGYMYVVAPAEGGRVAAVRDVGTSRLEPVVEIVELDGDVPVRIELAPGGVPGLAWSPDGKSLAVAAYPVDEPKSGGDKVAPVELAIYGLDGRRIRNIELPADARSSWTRLGDPIGLERMTWSPDGAWLALQGGDTWWLVAPDGSAARRIGSPNPAYLTGAPAWSPDGSRLAVALGGCPGPAGAGCPSPVWILDVAAGEWTSMGEPGERREGEHFGSVRWSPDGSRAAVLTTYPGAEPASSDRLSIATAIRIVDVDGQLVGDPIIEVLAEAFDAADGGGLASGEMIPSAPAWAPDGDELYYVSLRPRHASELRALPVGGGESMLMADDVETFAVAGY